MRRYACKGIPLNVNWKHVPFIMAQGSLQLDLSLQSLLIFWIAPGYRRINHTCCSSPGSSRFKHFFLLRSCNLSHGTHKQLCSKYDLILIRKEANRKRLFSVNPIFFPFIVSQYWSLAINSVCLAFICLLCLLSWPFGTIYQRCWNPFVLWFLKLL